MELKVGKCEDTTSEAGAAFISASGGTITT